METQTLSRSGDAPVNGLQMYYELHNESGVGTLLVPVHRSFSGIGTSFGVGEA